MRVWAVAAAVAAASAAPSQVGRWSSEIKLLPDAKLPHVPLLGNGYLGVAVDTNSKNADPFGPGRAGAVDLWLNTNAMWECAASGQQLPAAHCSRKALGGVSFRPQLGSGSSFSAEQRIGSAQLWTSRADAAGSALETLTYMHPAENTIVTELRWKPAAGGSPNVTVEVATWALNNATVDAAGNAVSRRMAQGSFRSMWSAIATNVVGAPAAAAKGGGGAAGTSVAVVVTAGQKLDVVTAVADNLLTSNDADPTPAAVAAAASADAASIAAAAGSWWESFWSKSSISLPTQPDIEAFWYGAQYITAGMSVSTDRLLKAKSLIPPSGLYGPWVTSDTPAWNGDYTLDYNQEAQYYGVYSSNHPELASAYFPPITEWEGAARAAAVVAANTANITCPSKTMHYACHLAPWGYQSMDTTIYMHWNGYFAALLFINDWEYTRNKTFAREVTYPLLDGLNAWSHCFLMNETTSGGYVLRDWNEKYPDEEHEGQKVPNPQIALSLMRRVASAQLDIARAVGLVAPDYLQEILGHLAPFNTAEYRYSEADRKATVWSAYEKALVIQSDMFSLYPLWPSEYVSGLDTDNATLAVAQGSSYVYSNFAHGRPVCIFMAAVRAGAVQKGGLGWTAEQIVDGFNSFLNNSQGPNLLPYAPGGGTENAGVSQAVNDMLVQAPDGKFIQLFPVWPKGHSASFKNLRTKGAFLVSASWDSAAATVSAVTVEATVASTCTLVNPWFPKDVRVCTGATLSGARVSWSMKPGAPCGVSPV
eukprot:TRINITY_DN39886_c0_g1_i1.p1 TRINITY_DN39886_c0_g1~~TRINITY_DN39886_c0_g1_i1.p1  ORF type:complete len:762 (+),score=211.77 TRINITY_DN39886_c0_g1_i1:54-2339(+)